MTDDFIDPSDKNKIMIIAGMHRSGTSLISQWLHACGLHLGKRLLGVNVGNAQGHFEDMDFLDIHTAHFMEHNLPGSGFVETNAPAFSNATRKKLQDIIDAKNEEFPEWGWKEPKTCLFLNEYNGMLPAAKFLVIHRDFRESVSSMISRIQKKKDIKHSKQRKFSRFIWNNFTGKIKKEWILMTNAQSFLKVWIYYNQQILDFLSTIDKGRYIVINYQSLLQNDKQIFSVLKNDWHFSLEYIPFKNIYEPKLLNKPQKFNLYVNKKTLQIAAKLQARLSTLEKY